MSKEALPSEVREAVGSHTNRWCNGHRDNTVKAKDTVKNKLLKDVKVAIGKASKADLVAMVAANASYTILFTSGVEVKNLLTRRIKQLRTVADKKCYDLEEKHQDFVAKVVRFDAESFARLALANPEEQKRMLEKILKMSAPGAL